MNWLECIIVIIIIWHCFHHHFLLPQSNIILQLHHTKSTSLRPLLTKEEEKTLFDSGRLFGKKKKKTAYVQVREVLASRRGTLQGVEDSFVDNMVGGLDAWTSAAGKNLIRWGFMVMRKKTPVCALTR